MNHAAGVSQPRVSRALCRSPMVNRETRKRILKHGLEATLWGQAGAWCRVHRARRNYRAHTDAHATLRGAWPDPLCAVGKRGPW
ncbi:MAG TPA: hypothetical protein DEO93_06885 [Stenotrophomonas sp.]|nr:hypothetical protein [Stenotrophomonas sp.]